MPQASVNDPLWDSTLVAFEAACAICVGVHVVLSKLHVANELLGPPAPLDAASPVDRKAQLADVDARFRSFLFRYLPVFILASFADWIMGPYIYSMYEDYGFSVADIGLLFVVGFGSSMAFGTFCGGLSDRYGRKQSCVLFCIVMALGCVLKNSQSLSWLLCGRVATGIATSLLFSSFESWAVSDFAACNLPAHLLPRMFSLATFSNALGAIVAGLCAENIAARFGSVGPSNAAIPVLAVCLGLILALWTENCGLPRPVLENFRVSARAIVFDAKTRAVALVAVVFEIAMYLFVFAWTPVLDAVSGGLPVPLGLVFSLFMVWKSIGTAVFQLWLLRGSVESIVVAMLPLAAAALVTPWLVTTYNATLAGCCVFELCIGVYWPSIYSLRSKYVDDDVRATTITLFRLPMNAIIALVLWHVGDLSMAALLLGCAVALLAATPIMFRLARRGT